MCVLERRDLDPFFGIQSKVPTLYVRLNAERMILASVTDQVVDMYRVGRVAAIYKGELERDDKAKRLDLQLRKVVPDNLECLDVV